MVNRFVLNEVSYFGPGAREVLPQEVQRLGLHKAFVATDKDLLKFGVADKVLKVLEAANIPYEMEIHELYSHIWRCIIEHADEIERCNVSKSKAVAQVRVRQMIDYIEQNFGNKITLDDMAAAACISKREVSRCFKENMGRTPFEYLIEYRIAKGKIKLLTTDDTVLEVALQCGFESASYFTRMFKRYEGISPLEFRNKMKKG